MNIFPNKILTSTSLNVTGNLEHIGKTQRAQDTNILDPAIKQDPKNAENSKV